MTIENNGVFILDKLRRRLRSFDLTNCACAVSEVEPSKTKIVRFSRFHPSRKRGRTFTFLGFEFYWFKDRNGTPRAMRRTAPSKQQSALRRMKAWLKPSRHLPKKQFFKMLKLKLIGHYNYYYVRGNSRAVWSFYSQVIKYTKKWLNRRRQHKSYTWEKLKRVLEYTGIPKPRPTEKRRLHQDSRRDASIDLRGYGSPVASHGRNENGTDVFGNCRVRCLLCGYLRFSRSAEVLGNMARIRSCPFRTNWPSSGLSGS